APRGGRRHRAAVRRAARRDPARRRRAAAVRGRPAGGARPVAARAHAARRMSAPAGADGPQAVRLDVWLWSARLMPTRSAATAACRGGHVRRNGEPVKAAQKIVVGDELRVRGRGRERVVVVTRILTTRVGAPIARTAYEDHSPEPPPQLAAAPPR